MIGLIITGVVHVSKLDATAPTIEKESIRIGIVQRGEVLCQVRGYGTLIPKEILWIPAPSNGRVLRVWVEPGAVLHKNDILVTLDNPELELAAQEAETKVKFAEAELAALKARLAAEQIDLKAEIAHAQSDCDQAQLEAKCDEELYQEQLTSDLQRQRSRNNAKAVSTRLSLEEGRLALMEESHQAQIAAQEAQLEQNKVSVNIKRKQVEALTIRAENDGILQQLNVEIGKQISAGTSVALVVASDELKARLRIPETQAKDILIGQAVYVDTHNGVSIGHVARIDPAAERGTVAVDVIFDDSLPKGARPDLSITGTIEIERLEDVLYIERPPSGDSGDTINLFRLTDNDQRAVRVPVELGRSSLNVIEIRSGLREGEQVILESIPEYNDVESIRLK